MAGELPSGKDEPLNDTGDGDSDALTPVVLKLSDNQIDHVVRRASGDDTSSIQALLEARKLSSVHVREMLADRYRTLQGDRRLSRSLLAGLLVLSCFPTDGVELGIKDVAERLELGASTVHRYVATLQAAGVLERDPVTRRYRLAVG